MKNKIASNVVNLYLVTIIKLLVPFIVMPYLARVLSVDQYAVYAYVRGVTTFVNLIVDYGFIYSSTGEIAKNTNDREKIQRIINNVTSAKIILSVLAIIISMILIITNHVSSKYTLYAFLTFSAACILNMLPDYLFRGLECMKVLSERMLISKTITTLLLFLLVRSERDFIIVAYLELLNAIISLLMTMYWLKREQYKLSFKFNLVGVKKELVLGFEYFISTITPSLYGALNTIVVGYCLSNFEIVYWSTSWSVVAAIMTLYLPISNAIFPTMAKDKDIFLVKKMFAYFMPVVVLGSVMLLFLSKYVFLILVGEKYAEGYYSLVLLLPVVILSFVSIMLGTPVLGAYGATKGLKNSALIAALFHLLGLFVLWINGVVTLVTIVVLRCLTELVCAMYRTFAVRRILKRQS